MTKEDLELIPGRIPSLRDTRWGLCLRQRARMMGIRMSVYATPKYKGFDSDRIRVTRDKMVSRCM